MNLLHFLELVESISITTWYYARGSQAKNRGKLKSNGHNDEPPSGSHEYRHDKVGSGR